MQIPSFSASAQAILSNSAQNIDGSRKEPASIGGIQSPENSSQLTGRSGASEAVQPSVQSVNQVADPQEAAIQTKRVQSADETLGTSLGLNVNTFA